jgi:hypothetical protein
MSCAISVGIAFFQSRSRPKSGCDWNQTDKDMAPPAPKSKKPGLGNRAFCLNLMGWLMGLEPTTTGITTLFAFTVFSVKNQACGFLTSNET